MVSGLLLQEPTYSEIGCCVEQNWNASWEKRVCIIVEPLVSLAQPVDTLHFLPWWLSLHFGAGPKV